MKAIKITMAIAALTLTTAICQAQPGGGEHPGKHERGQKHKAGENQRNHDNGDKLVKELGLTPKQAEQLKAIHQKQKAENKAIQEKMAPLKSEMKVLKEKKKALKEIRMKEIESLLTPEQFTKLNELKEKKKENSKEKKKESEFKEIKKAPNWSLFYFFKYLVISSIEELFRYSNHFILWVYFAISSFCLYDQKVITFLHHSTRPVSSVPTFFNRIPLKNINSI
jgi:Spy/CpxP family protein refolding chaperone